MTAMRTFLTSRIQCAVLLVALLLLCCSANAQRLTIDEELLSGLVQAKQDEIRSRVLRNFVSKRIGSSNLATYNTLNDMLDILLTEKNKTAMTRDLVISAAEYSVAYGITWLAITDMNDDRVNKLSHIAVDRGQSNGFRRSAGEAFSEWQEFRKAVKYESLGRIESLEASEKSYRVGESSNAYIIQYHDWLLDTTLALLRDPSAISGRAADSLRAHGLFIRSKQRPWQGNVKTKHSAFMMEHASHLAKVADTLRDYLAGLVLRADPFVEIAAAVGVLRSADLSKLSIHSLVGQTADMKEAEGGKGVQNKEIAALFDLFRHSIEIYRHMRTDNRFIAKLGDIINRYVITDDELVNEYSRFGFRIDVEAIILELEGQVEALDSPTRTGWLWGWLNVRPYFTIGLNYGVFRDPGLWPLQAEGTGLTTVAWAGEKIGLKWRLWDWKYTRGREPGEVFKFHGRNYIRKVRAREPLVSNCYVNVFASGLLYTVADLRSDATFSDPIVGIGSGLTWFNDLELNVNYAIPLRSTEKFEQNMDAGFWNVGIDIPIFQYIRAAQEKRAKK